MQKIKRRKKCRSFDEARRFTHKLKLKSVRGWTAYSKSGEKPDDIPIAVPSYYKKEWKGWGDFLGTGNIAPFNIKYRSFAQARKFVQKLKLKNKTKWAKHCKSGEKPDDIPANPRRTYEIEWKGWGDFLGTGNVSAQQQSQNYLRGAEAKKLARKVKKEIFGDKRITMKDWAAAYKAGKIPKELPSGHWDRYGQKK